MSRALARDLRLANDAYQTPPDVALACLRATVATQTEGFWVCEPSCGTGVFIDACRERWPGATVCAVDVDRDAPGLKKADISFVGRDWLTITGNEMGQPNWVVMNPPFTYAEAHIRHALGLATQGVGALLRLNFLEGQKRRGFWNEFPPAEVHVLSKRPSFTGGGTDATAYAWFTWRNGYRGKPVLGWL